MSGEKCTENGTDFACRVAAFGAIRRAAEVAREYDRIYREAFDMGDYSVYAYTPDGDDVRRAIRAALKADA